MRDFKFLLSFYKDIAAFQFYPYLNICQVKKLRLSLSQLRMPSHRINIETGRWARPTPIPLVKRKCIVCNKLADELHLIIECKLYSDLRSKYIPLYYRQRPNMYKLIELITSNNELLIKHLSCYTDHSFQVRSQNTFVASI
jgi:hypothetical protein